MSTEKNEKEIRQVNFRIDQASADAFRSFCTANGMNQAQGFDHLIQVLELNNAKAATPGRAVEIENFERLTKDLLAAYLTSLELGNTTEARVAERFKTDLQRKDRTIDELREKANDLPLLPGVYLMMDKTGTVIYVGKAKKLKNRVSQYFQDTASHTPKTRLMVSKIHHFDVIVAASEFEALVLE